MHQTTELQDLPSMTFLNATGDVTIMWTDDNRDAVLQMIEKKMKEGYSFFKIKELGRRGPAPRIKTPADLAGIDTVKVKNEVNGVHLDDDDLARMFEVGQVLIAPRSKAAGTTQEEPGGKKPISRIKEPEEVLNHKTIVTKPIQGG